MRSVIFMPPTAPTSRRSSSRRLIYTRAVHCKSAYGSVPLDRRGRGRYSDPGIARAAPEIRGRSTDPRAMNNYRTWYHGFRCARLTAGCALPVATVHRPSGAKNQGRSRALSLQLSEHKGIKIATFEVLGKRESVAYSVDGDELILAAKTTLLGTKPFPLRGEWTRVNQR